MFIRKVIGALEKSDTSYALVGGYAVTLHGAVRGTVGIDIAIAMNQAAFEKCEAALKSIGLEPRLPVTAVDVFNFRDEYINNRNMVAWSFSNPKNTLEMVDVLITEDAANLKTIRKEAFGLKLNVVAIPELIAMKKKSARPQDIEDIKALETLQ
jgi:hypothetical protein